MRCNRGVDQLNHGVSEYAYRCDGCARTFRETFAAGCASPSRHAEQSDYCGRKRLPPPQRMIARAVEPRRQNRRSFGATARPRLLRVPLSTVGWGFIAAAAITVLAWESGQWRPTGDDAGAAPPQPIPFSHRQHVAELEIDCLYCHFTASTGRYASMPAADLCMNCHRFVSAPAQSVKDEHWRAVREGRSVRRVVSEAMRQLYRVQGLDENLTPDPAVEPTPLRWIRVTRFPDLAYFDHRAHARPRIECQRCHGEVQTFDRTVQIQEFSMGWCIACHRDSNRDGIDGQPVQASLDCSSCHR